VVIEFVIIGSIELTNPVITAPMAGITDKAFREILSLMDPGMICTEMVSDKALTYGNRNTLELLEIEGERFPLCVQIFGSEPKFMAQAAQIVENKGADVIDINMGCPTPKIVKNGEGCALMKNPALVGEIVSAVVQAVSVPVTVKIRKGWDHASANAVQIAVLAQEAGASAVTVHGRTRDQFYSGKADWKIIAAVKQKLNIPVIGNGDIWSPEDAEKMKKETACDGVMIARGMLGNPWLVKRARELLSGLPVSKQPCILERIDLALHHLNRAVELKGEIKGVVQMRKHLAWYIKGLRDAARIRSRINNLARRSEVAELLLEYRDRVLLKEE